MVHCDVLIVGGGPAGSTCAWRLRRAGLDVAILDKRTFPRDKTCAGWVTPAVLQTLQLDTGDYAAGGRVLQPITGFRTGSILGRTTEVRYPEPVSFGIRRFEFDDYLLRRCGARLLLDEKLDTCERRGDEWVVNNRIAARVLIGAGGHFCPIARQLGAGVPRKETVVAAQEIEFPLTPSQRESCAVAGDTPELYFCEDLAGYAWCFRKGDYLNVGLGREDPLRVSEHVDAFRRWMIDTRRIPADTPEKFHGHAYILYGHEQRRTVDDGVMLIGDAAGLAYPQSGEGIRPAVESALLAAQTILEAGGDFSAAKLAVYADRLVERFGKPSESGAAAAWMPERLKRALAARLLATPWFSRHVVVDRWFLHTQQPALQV